VSSPQPSPASQAFTLVNATGGPVELVSEGLPAAFRLLAEGLGTALEYAPGQRLAHPLPPGARVTLGDPSRPLGLGAGTGGAERRAGQASCRAAHGTGHSGRGLEGRR
jgi:hypothetical protein